MCIIDTLVEEHCNQKIQEKLNESLRDIDEGFPEPSYLLADSCPIGVSADSCPAGAP